MGKVKRKKSKKKLFIIGGLALLLVVVILLLAFGGNKERIISVQTEEAKTRTITQVVSATGKINPIYQVILRPEVNGEIVELPVEEGDQVKKGQLLIRLKPAIYIARRNRARASLEATKATLKIRQATLDQVKAEFKRVQGLYAKELASDKELDNAKAALMQAEGSFEAQKAAILQADESLNDAQEELAKTAIYSPINGTVAKLNVELSERVLGSSFSQGTNLMTIADLAKMEARVNVDENDVVLIATGDTARIEIDAYDQEKFDGIVSHIGNSAITTGLGSQNEVVNFEVRIKLLKPIEKLRPGLSCDADIETETRFNVISVPIQSVTARMPKSKKEKEDKTKLNDSLDVSADQNKFKKKEPVEVVFCVENGQAVMKEVKTGISDDTYIEIKEGLEDGEKVVGGPYRAISKELDDGVKVNVQKRHGNSKKN